MLEHVVAFNVITTCLKLEWSQSGVRFKHQSYQNGGNKRSSMSGLKYKLTTTKCIIFQGNSDLRYERSIHLHLLLTWTVSPSHLWPSNIATDKFTLELDQCSAHKVPPWAPVRDTEEYWKASGMKTARFCLHEPHHTINKLNGKEQNGKSRCRADFQGREADLWGSGRRGGWG